MLGDKVVDALEGRLDPALQKLWAWPEKSVNLEGGVVYTEDGSRSGAKGLVLGEEMRRVPGGKGRESKL